MRKYLTSDLDGLDRYSAVEMAASPFKSQMVFVQPGFHAASEPVYLQRLEPLVGQPLRYAANCSSARTTCFQSGLSWTGYSPVSQFPWPEISPAGRLPLLS